MALGMSWPREVSRKGCTIAWNTEGSKFKGWGIWGKSLTHHPWGKGLKEQRGRWTNLRISSTDPYEKVLELQKPSNSQNIWNLGYTAVLIYESGSQPGSVLLLGVDWQCTEMVWLSPQRVGMWILWAPSMSRKPLNITPQQWASQPQNINKAKVEKLGLQWSHYRACSLSLVKHVPDSYDRRHQPTHIAVLTAWRTVRSQNQMPLSKCAQSLCIITQSINRRGSGHQSIVQWANNSKACSHLAHLLMLHLGNFCCPWGTIL